MKKETREYNYDWMLWTTITAAARALDGTEKEYESLKGVIPNFRNVLYALLRHGEPGQALHEDGCGISHRHHDST